MYCPHCGKQQEHDGEYCKFCGKSFTHTTKREHHEEKMARKQGTKHPYVILGIIFLIGISAQLYHLHSNYAEWIDSTIYLMKARNIAFGDDAINWRADRAILMPVLLSFFMKLGATDTMLKLVIILWSSLSVILLFFIGKELFDEKVGLFAAFFYSTYYLAIFYGVRIMINAPTVTFWLIGIYFFGRWKNSRKGVYWYLFCVMIPLNFMLYFQSVALGIFIGVFMLLTERKFLLNKQFYFGICIMLTCMIPFFVYNQSSFGDTFAFLTTGIETNVFLQGKLPYLTLVYSFFSMLPFELNFILFFLFLIGLYFIGRKLFLLFDKVITREITAYDHYLFVLLWVLIPLFIIARIVFETDPRYIMPLIPAACIVASIPLSKFLEYPKFNAKARIAGVIILLIIIGSLGVWKAHSLIAAKQDSYKEVRLSAEWIKENSQAKDVVYSNSGTMTAYYGRRTVHFFPESETLFLAELQRTKPKFMIISGFEAHPQYIYGFPQKYSNLVYPVKVYTQGGTEQPLLIVYAVNSQ